MESFSIQFHKITDDIKDKMDQVIAEILQDINEEIVRATPVDTGFLRGSWWASVGAPNLNGGGVLDKSGAVAVARMNIVAIGVQPGQSYYAMNGASYARYVEYGTSTMAPRAFVRRTMARAVIIAELAIARVAAR